MNLMFWNLKDKDLQADVLYAASSLGLDLIVLAEHKEINDNFRCVV